MLFLVKSTLESLRILEHLIIFFACKTVVPWHRMQEARLKATIVAVHDRMAGSTSVDLARVAFQTPYEFVNGPKSAA
jgi:hypothetical protein